MQSRVVSTTGLRLDDFEPDKPMQERERSLTPELTRPALIEGVELTSLTGNEDSRGTLHELLTSRTKPIEPIVHVYQVSAAAGSVRAWVYHQHQYDRLAFTDGNFDVVLYDLRPESSTFHFLNVLKVGKDFPCLLRIPPLVVHGVRNSGVEWAHFVNMPTKIFSRAKPDKFRLPYGDPRIPYTFE